MLKVLRNKKTQKAIYIALCIIIIPAFVLVGVMSSQDKGPGHASTLGMLENRSISVKDYLQSYKGVQLELMLMYGEKAGQIANFINLKGEAWDRLLLLDYAKKQNIKVSDREVVAWVTSQPAFLREGVFDDQFYKRYIREYFRLETRAFEEEIRAFLTLDKLRLKIRSEASATDKEVAEFYNLSNGARDIQYVISPWEAEKDKVSVTEEEMAQVFPTIQEEMKTPEKVKIRYIFVPKESEKTAEILGNKESLDATAKKYELSVEETGFFSNGELIPNIGLSPEITKASFSLSPTEESAWLSLDKGAYKIALVDKEASRYLEFSEAKGRLEELLTKHKAMNLAEKKLTNLKEKMKTASFDEVLKEAGLASQNAEKVKNGSYITGIGTAEIVLPAIESLKEGEVSEVLPVPAGSALVRVTKNWPADQAAFEKDKASVQENLMRKKSSENMQKLLETLRQKLKLNLETMKSIFPEETPAQNL